MKRGKHLLDLPAPLRRALHPQPVRQPRPNRLLGCVDRLGIEQLDLHAVHPSQTVEHQLRRRDVHQGQLSVHQTRRSLIEQQATHDGVVNPVADDQLHRRVEVDRMTSSEPFGEHHRRRVEQQRQQLLRPRLPAILREPHQPVLAERQVAQHVDTQHAYRVLGSVRRPDPGCAVEQEEIFGPVSGTPTPAPTISSEVLPATTSSAVSNPRIELALASRIATTTATPSVSPTRVTTVRARSRSSARTMNWRKSVTEKAVGKSAELHNTRPYIDVWKHTT